MKHPDEKFKKINNISFISPIHFNLFLKYDRVTSVLFTIKLSEGFIRRYKNYKQITHIELMILFLFKVKKLFHALLCVKSDKLIPHRFITKIRFCRI